MKKGLILIIIITILIIAGVYFGFKKQDSPNQNLNNFNGETKEFNIIAKQFSFEPSTITVNQGDLVKIKIKSIDVAHSITIPDFKINEMLDPNEEISFEFIADKTGEFNFFCMVYCGEGHGEMGGKLIVR